MTTKQRPVRDFLKAYPFSVLLASLIIMIIGSPFAGKLAKILPFVGTQGPIAPLVLILTLGASFALWPSVRSRATTIIVGGTVLALLYISSVFDTLTLIHLIGQAIFLLYVIVVVTRVVFRAPLVDGNILCGAACLYLLSGVFFGFLFCLIEYAAPGSFKIMDLTATLPASLEGQVNPDSASTLAKESALLTVNPGWLIYFSFTTLTTVGFGDILPTTETSRSFSALEAIIGQIMVVVMMARLVGLHVAQTNPGPHKTTVFEVGDEVSPKHSKSEKVTE